VPAELSDDVLKEFHDVAERAAAKVSRDPEVIGEAANFAVAELASRLDNVSPETPERVEFLIGEMRSGGGQSLGSFVADKIDFDNAWALISGQDRLRAAERPRISLVRRGFG